MPKPKVVVTHWVHDEVIALLSETCQVVANDTRRTLPREELLERCREAEAAMVFMPDRVDEDFLDHCPKLKTIAAALKGYDNIDVAACRRHGVSLSIVEDLLTEPTAELAAALLLGLARNIGPGDRTVRSGGFRGWRPVLYGRGLTGTTVGIVGMGAIGRALARRLRGFCCSLHYTDPRPMDGESETAPGLIRQDFDTLLAASDFLVLCVPFSAESFHLVDDGALEKMKPGSYLVNVGRGSVLDEAAVAKALSSGQLAGFAADVFEFEDRSRPDRPLTIHPGLLARNDKTLFTPHLGSAVDDIRKEIALEAARSILSALA